MDEESDMHGSLWQGRKTRGLRLGAALVMLVALIPLQHSGITLASAVRDGGAETATLQYIGTSDPAQLTSARTGALAPRVVGAPHGRAVPFLTSHRAMPRLAAAIAAPRLAGATVQASAATAPAPDPRLPLASGALGGFSSLGAADQFTTHVPINGGALADLEPPDDAICAGPGNQILQLINNVGAVYTTQGTRSRGPFTLESFFHESPPFSLSDPVCAYDPVAHAFYAEEWSNSSDSSGNVIASRLNLAINLSDDPTQPWSIFRIDVSDAQIDGCPCLPDYTQLGFDQKGIFLSTNQFTADYLTNPSPYVEARLTVIGKNTLFAFLQSKNPLAQPPRVFTYRLPNDFSLQPAVSYDPVTRTDAAQEYFVESLDNEGIPNKLSIFTFSNEAAFDGISGPGTPISTTVTSEPYSEPPAAVQKGFYGAITLDDDRALQVVHAGGALWAVLTTAVAFNSVDTDFVRAAAAWFKLAPSFSAGHVSATIAAQGYVAAPFYYFSYPALMLNNTGRAAMVLSVFRADPAYPYAGLTYPQVGVASGAGFNTLTTVAQSPMPDIGFTTVLFPPVDLGGSPDYLAGGGRWGDYSAASVDPAGSVVYLNTQWVPGVATRGSEANWGTFMVKFAP
jgi:hypothetical protein